MNTTAERVKAQRTPGLLAFRPAADGSGSFGILAGKVEDMTGPVVIAETFSEIRLAGEGAVDEARENARRIVACWNACEGAPIDLLEMHDAKFVLPELPYRYLLNQRDDLLAALEKMNRAYVNLIESGRDRILMLGGQCDPVDVMEAGDPYLRESKSAIAKVKGGAE